MATSAPQAAPSLQTISVPRDDNPDDRPTESKKKKKEKREKKEKKTRPQNALFTLAGTFGGGASVSANVVDLRALDASPFHVTSKRSIRTMTDEVPPTQILNFLFLGSVKDAQDPAFLAKHQIRYIINVSQEEYWSVDKRVQIVTFKVDDSATADIASLFPPTRNLINNVRDRYYRNEAAKKTSRPAVLVHCQKGRSRSVTIVLAYLIYVNGWSVAEAMKYVAARRPCAEPNIGFMEELRKLQESLTTDDRTRRYSELCWFMRNLDAHTSEAEVRETFENRVGMVRDVVMLTAPPSGAPAGEAQAALEDSGRVPEAGVFPSAERDAPLVSFSMDGEKGEEAGTSAACSRTAEETEGGAATHESAHIRSPHTPTPSTGRIALCFVFLTCREDILRGIKSGQLRGVLDHLRPAPGKQIKYATGPKLRKLMTEHQSMSTSFAQDMVQFDGQLRRGSDAAAGDGDNSGIDSRAAIKAREL